MMVTSFETPIQKFHRVKQKIHKSYSSYALNDHPDKAGWSAFYRPSIFFVLYMKHKINPLTNCTKTKKEQ